VQEHLVKATMAATDGVNQTVITQAVAVVVQRLLV
jgi:hypothetical protein